jgi:hypothetical protein
VKGGLTPEKNEVGVWGSIQKQGQPGFDGANVQGFSAVLVPVDVAVLAPEITFGENVKKKIRRIL